MKRSGFIICLILFAGLLSCGIFYIIDGVYYYSPWYATVSSSGCMAYDSNSDNIADKSLKEELEIAFSVMTKTTRKYSDTDCTVLDGTITSTSGITTGAYVDRTIIYFDSTAMAYAKWTNAKVSALEADITYESSTLNCETSACVTTYSGIISAAGCSTGTLTINTDYDYTSCEFQGQPATLYTLVYQITLKELVFGTSQVLSTDSVASYDGDTSGNRHKYLDAQERYILK